MGVSDIRAGGAFVEAYMKDKEFQAGVDRMQAKLQKLEKITTAIGKKLLVASMSILVPIGGAVMAYAKSGDALDKMSSRTATSVEFLSKLSHAAQIGGTDISAMEVGIRRMQRTAMDATRGLSTAVDTFEALNISVYDASGNLKSTEQLFMESAEALSKVENNTTKAALATMLFGRAGTSLLPMLKNGKDGLVAVMEEAEKLGIVLFSADATGAAEFTDAWTNIRATLNAVLIVIGGSLAPLLTTLLQVITPIVTAIIEWTRENGNIVIGITALGVALGAVASALLTVSGSVLVLNGLLNVLNGSMLTQIGLWNAKTIAIVACNTAIKAWLAVETLGATTTSVLSAVVVALKTNFSLTTVAILAKSVALSAYSAVTAIATGGTAILTGAIGLLGTVFSVVATIVGSVISVFAVLFTWPFIIGAAIVVLIGALLYFSGILGGIWRFIKYIFSGVLKHLGGLFDKLGGLIKGVFSFIMGLFDKLGGSLTSTLDGTSAALDKITGSSKDCNSALGDLKGTASSLRDIMSRLADEQARIQDSMIKSSTVREIRKIERDYDAQRLEVRNDPKLSRNEKIKALQKIDETERLALEKVAQDYEENIKKQMSGVIGGIMEDLFDIHNSMIEDEFKRRKSRIYREHGKDLEKIDEIEWPSEKQMKEAIKLADFKRDEQLRKLKTDQERAEKEKQLRIDDENMKLHRDNELEALKIKHAGDDKALELATIDLKEKFALEDAAKRGLDADVVKRRFALGRQIANLPDMKAVKRSIETQGTFSAAAASRSFGSITAMERTAEATEKIQKGIEELNHKADKKQVFK